MILLWLAVIIIGSFNIKWNFFLKSHHKNYSIKNNVIALTFDDGPNQDITPKLLQVLKKHKAKATFFCIGKNIENHPEIVKQINNENHIVANHSYNHSNSFGFLSTKKVIEEIENTKNIIEKVIGKKAKFFRPPFGVTNPNIANAVRKLDLISFGWSVRSLDTIINEEDKLYKRIVKSIKKGDVILMHDTSNISVLVLDRVLVYLSENNIKTTTLDKLFNIKAYE